MFIIIIMFVFLGAVSIAGLIGTSGNNLDAYADLEARATAWALHQTAIHSAAVEYARDNPAFEGSVDITINGFGNVSVAITHRLAGQPAPPGFNAPPWLALESRFASVITRTLPDGNVARPQVVTYPVNLPGNVPPGEVARQMTQVGSGTGAGLVDDAGRFNATAIAGNATLSDGQGGEVVFNPYRDPDNTALGLPVLPGGLNLSGDPVRLSLL